MVAFIDQHRDTCGVESICTVVPIAPSTYFRHKAQHADPDRRSARAREDDVLRAIIHLERESSGLWTAKSVEADGA